LHIRQAHIGIMGCIRHINDRFLPRLFFQIFSPEVYPVVVSVRAAERNKSPNVFYVKAVVRCEYLYDLPFKFQSMQIITMGVERISPALLDIALYTPLSISHL